MRTAIFGLRDCYNPAAVVFLDLTPGVLDYLKHLLAGVRLLEEHNDAFGIEHSNRRLHFQVHWDSENDLETLLGFEDIPKGWDGVGVYDEIGTHEGLTCVRKDASPCDGGEFTIHADGHGFYLSRVDSQIYTYTDAIGWDAIFPDMDEEKDDDY